MKVSVVIPAYNSHPSRLNRTLAALKAQTLPPDTWETLLVDNASSPPLRLDNPTSPPNLELVREPEPGLTLARRRGFLETSGEFVVFVDDDNLLEPSYLENALNLMTKESALGAAGGKILPEFEQPPKPWVKEFEALLALRDLGERPLKASWKGEYPECAPVGAGMVLRREAAKAWLESSPSDLTDRRGKELSSGGDNDIVLCLLKAGWEVAYEPALILTHLIPAERLEPDYLARLNRGIQKSWMRVLSHHGINPWPPIPAWTVPPRRLKAWLACQPWTSPAARIRWQGACGHFEGRSLAG